MLYTDGTFHGNWLKVGFGRDFGPPHESLPLIYDYRHEFTREIRDPFSEAVEAARLIYETCPRPINVLLSGGVDSQAVVLAFQAAGVEFNVVSFSYNGERNSYDNQYARWLCERESIDLQIIDVDLKTFHESGEIIEWGIRYGTRSPHMASQIYAYRTSGLTGTVVLAGNPVLPRGSKANTIYRGLSNWHMTVHNRIPIEDKPFVVGFFHSYTPELHYSWQQVDMADMTEAGARGGADYGFKCALFLRGGFGIIPQQNKTHGFEWLKADIEAENAEFWRDFIHEYDRLYRRPLEEAVKVSSEMKAIWNPSSYNS